MGRHGGLIEDVFLDKRVLLGVSGGISAFKAVELLRLLTKAGAQVDVIMTEDATRFVGEATMRGLSGRPVLLDLFDLPADMKDLSAVMPHLEPAEKADLALVVPATANTLAKMAGGLADNALTTTLLSVRAPVIVAPAMDNDMWLHPATQANIALLKKRGVRVVGPVSGTLARGNVGEGRLVEPPDIMAFAARVLAGDPEGATNDGERRHSESLAGRHIMVTAGGTQEPIDPVRYIGNHSSGKMGFAVAQAALDAGARVTIICGSTSEKPPAGCEVVAVTTAAQMHEHVIGRAPTCDAVIMAAAVADYRVAEVAQQKIKKDPQDDRLHVTLVANADIAADVGARRRDDQMLVIFAAETENLQENARRKLADKKAQLAVANNVAEAGSGFGTDTNKVRFFFSDGREEDLPLMSKRDVARRLIAHVAQFFGGGPGVKDPQSF